MKGTTSTIFRWAIPLILPLVTLTILGRLLGQPALAAVDPLPPGQEPPDGVFVVRVYYETIEEISLLSEYDLWEYNNLKEKYVLVAVDRAAYDRLLAGGWRVALDEIATSSVLRPAAAGSFFDQYRTVDQLYAYLAATAATYPTLTELVDYGDSYCKVNGGCVTLGGENQSGYDLLAIRVSNEAISGTSTLSSTASLINTGTKPVLFLMANTHAREITTPELAMRLLDWLLQGYGRDAQLTWLVDWQEIWIVPTANPDGHWLVELGESEPYNSAPFYQRKNANRSQPCFIWPPTSAGQYGVDLNRNHSFLWGGDGSSDVPCSQTYRGPAAASEPEVAQLQTLLQSLFLDQRGPDPADSAPQDTRGLFITLHSYSELILWPWGHTSQPAPNLAGLQAIGDKLANYNGYLSCQSTSCLYAASGASDDWVYGELGVPAFTFEVGQRFMPAYDEIEGQQWPRNRPAFLYAAQIARAPYELIQGPDTLDIATTIVGRETLNLSAVIDDRQNGFQPIAAAVYSIDTPDWITGTLTYPLIAADGAFDASVETVSGTIDSSALIPGRHILFLRGQDSAGHWGPTSAIFFYAGPTNTHYLPFVQHSLE